MFSDMNDIQTASDAELIRMARLTGIKDGMRGRRSQRHKDIVAEMKKRGRIALNPDGIVAGAKQAAADGLSFDDYCKLIAKVVISGQTVTQVRQLLINAAIDTYFWRSTQ